jgi:hypothetical protein
VLSAKRGIMSRNPALYSSPNPHQASHLDAVVRAPRPVDATEQPVDSPVHALQRELARIEPQTEAGDSVENRLPGWLWLGLPLAAPIGLWLVIIQFISAIWPA